MSKFESDLSELMQELGRLNFKRGYITARIEQHIRMIGIIDSLAGETEPPPSKSPSGIHTGSATDVIWGFLSDGRETELAEIRAHAVKFGFTKANVGAALSRLVSAKHVVRVRAGLYRAANVVASMPDAEREDDTLLKHNLHQEKL